jgi:hypothetical protein
MRTKAANTASSTTVLLVVLAAAWLFIAATGHTETPVRDPWTWFPEFYLPPALLLVVPWLAARLWYGLSVFFGYGAFLVLPAAWGLFGPAMRHGFLTAIPPYCVPETLAFCCAGGLFAAFIGWYSHHRLTSKSATSNHGLQRTAFD